MKYAMTLLFFLLSISMYGQEKPGFDGHKWEAPYHLPVPNGWTIERFLVPPSFAPGIQHRGVEDIRFTPGWSKTGSNEYWSYAFLWLLDTVTTFDAKMLEKNLTAYYTGLFYVNTGNNMDTSKLMPVKVSISEKKAVNGNDKTFDGLVAMNDYMTEKPINLNLVIHTRYCEALKKTVAFFALSPKPYANEVWKSLQQLWLDFKCTKP